MDVLHFIKSYHEEVVHVLGRLDLSHDLSSKRGFVDDIERLLKVYLHLEEHYLYPEIDDLFSGVDELVRLAEVNASVIRRRLSDLRKLTTCTSSDLGTEWEVQALGLKDSILEHFRFEERHLLPKLRLKLRTEVREELGQVFLDVRHELVESLPEMTLTSGNSLKRA